MAIKITNLKKIREYKKLREKAGKDLSDIRNGLIKEMKKMGDKDKEKTMKMIQQINVILKYNKEDYNIHWTETNTSCPY